MAIPIFSCCYIYFACFVSIHTHIKHKALLAEADMKREMERKEQEKKKSQKVEYISGGTQPGTVVPTPKVNIPIPGRESCAI